MRPIFCIVALSLFLLSPEAFGGDKKIYPASMCRENAPVQSNFEISGNHTTNVRNTHTTYTQYLQCPLVEDNFNSSTAFASSSITIYFIDEHPTSNVSCTWYHKNPSTGATNYASVTSSGDGSSFDSRSITTSISSAGTESFAYMSCSIPAADASGNRSAISRYVVEEY